VLCKGLDPSVFSSLGSGGDLSGDGRIISRYLHTVSFQRARHKDASSTSGSKKSNRRSDMARAYGLMKYAAKSRKVRFVDDGGFQQEANRCDDKHLLMLSVFRPRATRPDRLMSHS